MHKYFSNHYLLIITAFVSITLLASCQDEDYGYTREEIFKNAYERNFVQAFGPIDENETWDFSQYGNRPVNYGMTRAGILDGAEDGWYRVDQSLMDGFFKGTLAEGRDNSGTGETFCFMAGGDDFTLIPIYKGSTAQTWTLYMKVYAPDASSGTQYKVWRNNDDAIKIQNPGCTVCGGRGYVDEHSAHGELVVCTTCNNTGKVVSPFCLICNGTGGVNGVNCTYCGGDGVDDHEPCRTCNGSGEVVTKDCPECIIPGATIPGTDTPMPAGKVKCTVCGGRGFTDTNGHKPYNACTACGGNGSTNAYGQAKKPSSNNQGKYTQGKKIMDCPVCGGTGHDKHTECPECHGGKYYVTCPVCLNTPVYKCTNCNGTGLDPESGWKILSNNNEDYKHSTFGAYAIEGNPISISEITNKAKVPTGSIFFFFLTTGNTTKTSMDGSMKLFTPDGLNAGSDVKLIACEEGDGVKDYNDLVFLIKGKPTAIYTEPESEFTTLVKKRYMCEDLGSYRDWDFNDLVVDVTRSTKHTLKGSGSNLTNSASAPNTIAMVEMLLGTLPITFSIGGDQFPVTIDPTKPFDTVKNITGDNQLTQADVPTYEEGTPWTDEALQMKASKWNPDLNNISITVTAEDGGKNNDGVWQVDFPRKGGIPYIIATDQTDAPTIEYQDIRQMPWFQQKFMVK